MEGESEVHCSPTEPRDNKVISPHPHLTLDVSPLRVCRRSPRSPTTELFYSIGITCSGNHGQLLPHTVPNTSGQQMKWQWLVFIFWMIVILNNNKVEIIENVSLGFGTKTKLQRDTKVQLSTEWELFSVALNSPFDLRSVSRGEGGYEKVWGAQEAKWLWPLWEPELDLWPTWLTWQTTADTAAPNYWSWLRGVGYQPLDK